MTSTSTINSIFSSMFLHISLFFLLLKVIIQNIFLSRNECAHKQTCAEWSHLVIYKSCKNKSFSLATHKLLNCERLQLIYPFIVLISLFCMYSYRMPRLLISASQSYSHYYTIIVAICRQYYSTATESNNSL